MIVFLTTALLLVISCGKSNSQIQKFDFNGNKIELEIRDASPQSVASATSAVQQLLNRQHAFSHAWKPSELSKINLALAAGNPSFISKSNLHLLELSRPIYIASDAYYDPSIGFLVKMWGFNTDQFPISEASPTTAAISDWLAHKPAFLDIKIKNQSIAANNPRTQLDFSGILKGIIEKEIRAIFAQEKIDDALVTIGSDLLSIGNENTKAWTVMLKDPFGGDLGRVNLQGNEALFSSGNFNKFRVAPTGSRWSHVLNPRTGKPAQGSAAVVVLHSDPVLADAASTALMAAGPGNFSRLVMRMKLACAMMVTEENELLITMQMKKRVTFFRDPVPLGKPIANGESCK